MTYAHTLSWALGIELLLPQKKEDLVSHQQSSRGKPKQVDQDMENIGKEKKL